jgi:mannonate dehydratase
MEKSPRSGTPGGTAAAQPAAPAGLTRRAFLEAAAAGAAAGAAWTPAPGGGLPEAGRKLEELSPGIKVTLQVSSSPGEQDFQFARQLGVEHLSIPSGGAEATRENFLRWRKEIEAAGLKLWNIGNSSVHNMPEVTLNLPGRDRKIEEYLRYLRDLAAAGIGYTTYAHMGNGIWSSPRETTRGGAPARAFHLETAKGYWAGKVFEGPLTHGRVYSQEELWENFRYFIRAVVPVAEELGLRIGIHPDDPPVPVLGGVPRCIFGNFEGYARALEAASSPNIGVCLCCGTWLEGGRAMGKDLLEAIRAFAGMGKLWKIHFRNVSGPVPHFVESFVDGGMMDMRKVMKTLREVDFRGAVIADHVPEMAGGRNAGWGYSIGYIKGLLAGV